MNVTNIVTSTHIDSFHMYLDICRIDPFLEIGASSSIALESEYCAQTISFIIATIIGLFSMLYRISFEPATNEKTPENIAPSIEFEPEYESESESESEPYGDEINAMFEMFEDYESETEAVQSVNELFEMFQNEYDSDEDDDDIKYIKTTQSFGLFPLSITSQSCSFIIDYVRDLCSMLYDILARFLWKLWPGFRLHFIGIGRPKSLQKSRYKMFDNINTEHTMISVQSPLKSEDTVFSLKEFIRSTYSIADSHDIFILYSHHIISHDEQRTLKEIGITNNSLLTLAICDENKCVISPKLEQQLAPEPEAKIEEKAEENIAEIIAFEVEYESESESEGNGDDINAMFEMYEDYESETEPVESVNELFGMFTNEYDSDEDIKNVEVLTEKPAPPTWPRLGFDIITQEHDVLVHKMPGCGHEMNADSLYQYALNSFHDSSTVHLKCPHKKHNASNESCDTKWEYSLITDILRYDGSETTKKNEDKWIDYAKLELLSSRNLIENECNVQKCPRCHTLYYKNYDENAVQLEDIKTVEDIEKEFKFQCILCPDDVIEIEQETALKAPEEEKIVSAHNEDAIEEDIDGNAVNILFEMDDDDESDEDEDDDYSEALFAIANMFDDDDDEDDDDEAQMICKSLNEFCFCCGSQWELGHICDSSFREDLVSILSQAELKKIGSVKGVPSIRCCPSCCQLIFHVDSCKHMGCRGCKTSFCFVCLKPQLNGNWQCGSHSDKCPVADKQNKDTLPDTIVITKKSFQLF